MIEIHDTPQHKIGNFLGADTFLSTDGSAFIFEGTVICRF